MINVKHMILRQINFVFFDGVSMLISEERPNLATAESKNGLWQKKTKNAIAPKRDFVADVIELIPLVLLG